MLENETEKAMDRPRNTVKSAQRISETERQKRLDATNFARGSVRLEGFILDDAAECLTRRYVHGELTPDEFLQMALALAGVTDQVQPE
jgi:hypothetical protein